MLVQIALCLDSDRSSGVSFIFSNYGWILDMVLGVNLRNYAPSIGRYSVWLNKSQISL